MKTPSFHQELTFSDCVNDEPEATVAEYEDKKGARNGTKLMAQMQDILKISQTPDEKIMKKSQVWRTPLSELKRSKEDLNVKFKRYLSLQGYRVKLNSWINLISLLFQALLV